MLDFLIKKTKFHEKNQTSNTQEHISKELQKKNINGIMSPASMDFISSVLQNASAILCTANQNTFHMLTSYEQNTVHEHIDTACAF